MCEAYVLKSANDQYLKNYYIEHREEILTYQKKYYEKNKQDRIDYQRQYISENFAKISDYQKRYRETHVLHNDRVREQKKEWARRKRLADKLKKANN